VDRLLETRDRIIRLPGRAIGFAGDLTRAEVEELAATLLPGAGETPEQLDPPVSPVQGERAVSESLEMKNLTQDYLGFASSAPGWNDPRYPAYLVANHVLGGHFFSRLYVALRHDDGDTYGARSRPAYDLDSASVTLGTFTRADNSREIQDKLRETLATFHRDGITEEERIEAVRYLEGRLRFDQQSPFQVLGEINWETATGMDRAFEIQAVEQAAALSLDEINSVISDLFDPEDFTMVVLSEE
jgi:zinc protease